MKSINDNIAIFQLWWCIYYEQVLLLACRTNEEKEKIGCWEILGEEPWDVCTPCKLGETMFATELEALKELKIIFYIERSEAQAKINKVNKRLEEILPIRPPYKSCGCENSCHCTGSADYAVFE